jgi:hypothetical protein
MTLQVVTPTSPPAADAPTRVEAPGLAPAGTLTSSCQTAHV